MPALPLDKAGPYVAGAYLVFLALVLIYVAIMARKQARTERELKQLRSELAAREQLEHVGESTHQTSQRPERSPRTERAQEPIA